MSITPCGTSELQFVKFWNTFQSLGLPEQNPFALAFTSVLLPGATNADTTFSLTFSKGGQVNNTITIVFTSNPPEVDVSSGTPKITNLTFELTSAVDKNGNQVNLGPGWNGSTSPKSTIQFIYSGASNNQLMLWIADQKFLSSQGFDFNVKQEGGKDYLFDSFDTVKWTLLSGSSTLIDIYYGSKDSVNCILGGGGSDCSSLNSAFCQACSTVPDKEKPPACSSSSTAIVKKGKDSCDSNSAMWLILIFLAVVIIFLVTRKSK